MSAEVGSEEEFRRMYGRRCAFQPRQVPGQRDEIERAFFPRPFASGIPCLGKRSTYPAEGVAADLTDPGGVTFALPGGSRVFVEYEVIEWA